MYQIEVETHGLGVLLAVEGDECEALAGVVDVSHHAELLELGLEIAIGHVLVDSIDEEFATLLSHCDVVVWILEEIVFNRFFSYFILSETTPLKRNE